MCLYLPFTLQARNIITIRRTACGVGYHSEHGTQCGKWSKAYSKEEVATDHLQGCEHEVARRVDLSNVDALPSLAHAAFSPEELCRDFARQFNYA
jgi:hypothetical protein